MRRALNALLLALALSCAAAGVRAQPPSPPPPERGPGRGGARPWISLAFAGAGWSQNTIDAVLADLRADLAPRRIDLHLADDRRYGVDRPIASIRISTGGRNAVGIRVEVPEGGTTRTVARVTALDAVPPDGRPLAIALTAGELLRVSWVQIALRQATEDVVAVPLPARTPARTAAAAAASTAPRGTSGPPSASPSTSAGTRAASTAPAIKAPVVTSLPPPAGSPPQIAAASPPPQPTAPSVAPAPAAQPPVDRPTVSAAVAARAASPPDDAAALRMGVFVGATALAAPAAGTDNVPAAAGVAVRVAVTGQSLGWSAGVMLPTQASLEFGDTIARERRIPLDVGGRAVWRGDWFIVGADVGLLVAWRRIEGVTLARNSGASGVDVGTRAGLTLSFGGGRFAPWLGVTAEFIPVPASISFAPSGNAGHAPSLWGGVAAGFRVGARGASDAP